MPEFDYSVEAKNILGLFHRVDAILYVEGVDDELFWGFMFERFSKYSVKPEAVGGKPKLMKTAQEIADGTLQHFAAMDSDFCPFKEMINHRNVLYTFGYSIENTIVFGKSVCEVGLSHWRIPPQSFEPQDCEEFIERFLQLFLDVIFLDILNFTLGKGENVLGCSYERFVRPGTSPLPCPEAIEGFVAELPFEATDGQKTSIQLAARDIDRSIGDFVRGHFLVQGVRKYLIKEAADLGKKASISNDALFGGLWLAFKGAFESNHLHFEYYKNNVGAARVPAN